MAVSAKKADIEARLRALRVRLEAESESDGPRSTRGKRRRYGEIPEDAWRQFTPSVIDEKLCRARVRNLGKGGQCRSRHLPGRDLCFKHSCQKSLKYGRVTEPIPEREMRGLLREAEKKQEGDITRGLRQKALQRVKEEGESHGGEIVQKAPARASRQQRHWYTRALMWHFARERFDAAHGGALGSIRELAPEEYRSNPKCLSQIA